MHEYGSRDLERVEPPEPAAAFLARWAPTLAEGDRARDPGWVYILANALEASAESLAEFAAQYENALEPGELANVHALAERLRFDERQLGHWAEDIDPDFERRGVREHLPPLTPGEVARNVQNRAVQLVPFYASVADDYRSLSGSEMTTQTAWESVTLARAMMDIVAGRDREAEDDSNA